MSKVKKRLAVDFAVNAYGDVALDLAIPSNSVIQIQSVQIILGTGSLGDSTENIIAGIAAKDPQLSTIGADTMASMTEDIGLLGITENGGNGATAVTRWVPSGFIPLDSSPYATDPYVFIGTESPVAGVAVDATFVIEYDVVKLTTRISQELAYR